MSQNTNQVSNGWLSAIQTGAFLVGKICSAFNSKKNDAVVNTGPLTFQKNGDQYSIKNNSNKQVLVFFSSTDNKGKAQTGSILINANDTNFNSTHLIKNNMAGNVCYSIVEDNKPVQFSISDWSNENPFVVMNNTFTVNFIASPTEPKIMIAADRDYTNIMITLITQNKESYTFGPIDIDHTEVATAIICPTDMNQSIPFKNFIVSFTPTEKGVEKLISYHKE